MIRRRLIGIAALTIALVLFFSFVLHVDFDAIETFLKRSGAMAPALFCLLMILGILIAPIPTSPLTVMSAKLFGLWLGLSLTLLSATIGATIAFVIARTLGDRFLARHPEYRRLQKLLPPGTSAFAVFLLRLPPSPTFDAVSYLAGLTAMPLWQFMVATFLGMIPVTTALSVFGALAPGIWLWPMIGAVFLFSLIRLRQIHRDRSP